MQELPFEHQLIYDTVGEEKYYELISVLGGMQISFRKATKESILYWYSKGLDYKEIAYKLRVSERYVRQVLITPKPPNRDCGSSSQRRTEGRGLQRDLFD